MQRNPVLHVSVDISANACSCVRRSLDNQLCIREIPDLANNASRVALSVSLERDCHRAHPLEACDFVVSTTACATSIGTSTPEPELSTLSPLG